MASTDSSDYLSEVDPSEDQPGTSGGRNDFVEESATYSPTHIRSTPLLGGHPCSEVIAAAVRAIAQRADYLLRGGSGDLDWAAISIVEKQTYHGQGVEVTVPIKKKERQS